MARTATLRGSRSKIDVFGGLQPIPPSSPDPGSDPGPAARSRSDSVAQPVGFCAGVRAAARRARHRCPARVAIPAFFVWL